MTVPSRKPNNEEYEFGPFRVDVFERVLTKGQEIIQLTPKAFETLVVLVRKSGQVVEKHQLLIADHTCMATATPRVESDLAQGNRFEVFGVRL